MGTANPPGQPLPAPSMRKFLLMSNLSLPRPVPVPWDKIPNPPGCPLLAGSCAEPKDHRHHLILIFFINLRAVYGNKDTTYISLESSKQNTTDASSSVSPSVPGHIRGSRTFSWIFLFQVRGAGRVGQPVLSQSLPTRSTQGFTSLPLPPCSHVPAQGLLHIADVPAKCQQCSESAALPFY